MEEISISAVTKYQKLNGLKLKVYYVNDSGSRFHFKTKCKIHSGVIYHYTELICDLILAAKNRGTNVTHTFFGSFQKHLLFSFCCCLLALLTDIIT